MMANAASLLLLSRLDFLVGVCGFDGKRAVWALSQHAGSNGRQQLSDVVRELRG